MEKYLNSNSSTLHFLCASAAAALALGPARKSKWRYALYSLAAMEVWNGLSANAPAEQGVLPEAAPEKFRTAIVKGIKMRWEEHGEPSADSLPIVMVHGLPTNPRAWRYVIPMLPNSGVHCFVWENVGFGWSMEEGFGRDISIPKQAEYLYNWLQQMRISKAIFVAHDFGGGVVQHLLVKQPELALGLVLSDAVAFDNWPVKAVRAARSMAGVIENLPPGLVKPFFLAGLYNLGHQNSAIKEESVSLFWAPYERPIGPKAFAHQLRHFSNEDTKAVAPFLERIKVPARVIWGGKDPLGLSSATGLASALKAPMIKIPGGKHFTIEDHPDIIATAVKQVIAQIKNSK